MKNKKKRILWWIIAIIAVAVIVFLIFRRPGERETFTYNTVPASISDISTFITATGTIEPVTEVEVGTQVSGIIADIFVDYNSIVKKGQIIAEMDKVTLESELASAQAAYDGNKAEYKYQEKNYARSKGLYEKQLISDSEYEQAEYNYEMAKSAFHSSEAALAKAERNLSYATIASPIDGIVSSLSVEKGERVVGTSQMAGTEMLRIADFDMMEVLVDVNENDIIRITKGDTADIEVDAYPGRTFKGVVTQIANSAKNLGSTTAALTDVTNFEVKVRILRESYADLLTSDPIPFRPGMSASVEIETERKDGVTKIPLQAVTPDGCVFVLDRQSSTVRKVAVTTGIQDIENIEVISGLGAADTVEIVTGPYSTISRILEDGMEVRPQTDNDYTKDNEQ